VESDDPALLWRRIHEHKMVQWTIAYIAVAYGVQHAVILTSESFEWPQLVSRITMLLLVLGLPVAITVAWYQGARASRRFSTGECTIIAILLAMSSVLFYAYVQPSAEIAGSSSRAQQASVAAPKATGSQQSGVAAARQASLSPATAISLAVLAFSDLSPEANQGYFSDGITQEITSALAKIRDLRVVGRQSAFQFKGKSEDLRTIGKALGATHLLEGSVRKAGNELRIAADLVRADDGVTVWSNTYDRELKDVFAIQEDIAKSIATSLHMTLGLKPGEQLISARSANPASHQAYLKARALVRSRGLKPVSQAIHILQDVVATDPNYAPAWGLLGTAHHDALLSEPSVEKAVVAEARTIVKDHLSKGMAAAQRAIALDPDSPDGYLAFGEIRVDEGERIAGMLLMQQGLALDPDNPEGLDTYSNALADLGFAKDAISIREHLLAVEPFVPVFQVLTARILFADGQTDAAVAMMKSIQGPYLFAARLDAAQGKYREAADDLVAVAKAAQYAGLAKIADTAASLLRALPAIPASKKRPELGRFDWVYAYAGVPEGFLGPYEAGIQMGFQHLSETRALEWAPAYAAVRKTNGFKKYARAAGMVAYWRAKGWPPQCHTTTGDDFECN
jgi:TolB-like protein